jgi:DNA-directed RNA polymerase sigma subunit (sigma70/sigma32)
VEDESKTTTNLADLVLRLAEQLPPSDFQVIDLVCRLSGRRLSLSDAAKAMNVSKERFRQMRAAALQRLRLAVGDESLTAPDLEDLLIAGRMRRRAGLGPGDSEGDRR